MCACNFLYREVLINSSDEILRSHAPLAIFWGMPGFELLSCEGLAQGSYAKAYNFYPLSAFEMRKIESSQTDKICFVFLFSVISNSYIFFINWHHFRYYLGMNNRGHLIGMHSEASPAKNSDSYRGQVSQSGK